ncbi:MAG: ubiquinol-cytochrome C chaperone family protein [Alphaproteobacteria bacterium]
MVLSDFFRRKPRDARARALYERVVAQARQPGFYRDCGVPDTVDGRFESIALHAFLVLHRLKADPGDTEELGQALFDVMFQDMDQSLRELGAGDLGVGPRVKRMAQGLYGRIAAYEAGLSGPAAELEAALRRNLFGTVTPEPDQVRTMAAYLRGAVDALARWEPSSIESESPDFGAPPEVPNQSMTP